MVLFSSVRARLWLKASEVMQPGAGECIIKCPNKYMFKSLRNRALKLGSSPGSASALPPATGDPDGVDDVAAPVDVPSSPRGVTSGQRAAFS